MHGSVQGVQAAYAVHQGVVDNVGVSSIVGDIVHTVGPHRAAGTEFVGLHRPLHITEFASAAVHAVEDDVGAVRIHVAQTLGLAVAVHGPSAHVAVEGMNAVAVDQDGLGVGGRNAVPVHSERRQARNGQDRGE